MNIGSLRKIKAEQIIGTGGSINGCKHFPQRALKNQGGKKWIGLFVLFAAIIIAILLAFWSTNESVHGDDSTHTGNYITYDDAAVEGGWDSLSEEEIVDSLNKKVEDGYINISMNAAPVFADGQSEGNLMIVNESVNRYPQQVVITREDTGETIYTSNAIPVGSKIAADTLDVDLKAGTYDCTAMFHSLDSDTGAVLGSAGANITITIQH